MATDHSPVGYTCSKIDEVINVLNEEDPSQQDINHAIDQLESIRKDNSELREWGNEKHEEVEELKSDLEEKDSDIHGLENTIEVQRRQIQELKDEIFGLKDQLEAYQTESQTT